MSLGQRIDDYSERVNGLVEKLLLLAGVAISVILFWRAIWGTR